MRTINRCDFLRVSASAAVGLLLATPSQADTGLAPNEQPRIPRRRGLNLSKLNGGRWGQVHVESPLRLRAIDSGKVDVRYEDFHGQRLDRKMLELVIAG